jgi:hypothetical protein
MPSSAVRLFPRKSLNARHVLIEHESQCKTACPSTRQDYACAVFLCASFHKSLLQPNSDTCYLLPSWIAQLDSASIHEARLRMRSVSVRLCPQQSVIAGFRHICHLLPSCMAQLRQWVHPRGRTTHVESVAPDLMFEHWVMTNEYWHGRDNFGRPEHLDDHWVNCAPLSSLELFKSALFQALGQEPV